MRLSLRGVSFEISDPFPVTLGGAGGRRVVTVAFSDFVGWRWWRSGLMAHMVAAADLEVDPTARTDAQYRRRAGRAVVPVLRRYVRDLQNEPGLGQIERSPRRKGVCTAVFVRTETFDGLERRLALRLDIRFEDEDTDADILKRAVPFAAQMFEGLAVQLHAALDDPYYEMVFGRA